METCMRDKSKRRKKMKSKIIKVLDFIVTPSEATMLIAYVIGIAVGLNIAKELF